MATKFVREVWSCNVERELCFLQHLLTRFRFVSFDTEFPGCLRSTRRYASEETRFSDMRYNVNRTKLIQLGITISDAYGRVGGVWEFNFKDFDEKTDDHAPASIALLKQNGIDFDRLRKEGISIDYFGGRLTEVIRRHRDLNWVTFHGLYDAAYLMKLLTKREIPENIGEFRAAAGRVFGCICDVKYMAGLCEGLERGEIGLEKMANRLGVDRIGTAHRAGSDSLLTQAVCEMILRRFNTPPELFEGFLYGLSSRILPPEVMVLGYPIGAVMPLNLVHKQIQSNEI